MRSFSEQLAETLMSETVEESNIPQISRMALAKELRLHLDLLSIRHEFKFGDLVQIKAGLGNKIPPHSNVAIVSEVLAEPVFDGGREAATPYFREPLDIKIAYISHGRFVEFHYDSRRLEPYVEIPEEALQDISTSEVNTSKAESTEVTDSAA